MTTNHHTPLSAGDPVDADIINAPLSQLDQAIGDSLIEHVLWSQATESAAADTDAPAISELSLTTDFSSIIAARVAYQKEDGVQGVGLRGQYYLTSAGSGIPLIQLYNAVTGTDSFDPEVEDAWTDFDEDDLGASLSGVAAGETVEIQVLLATPGSTKNIKVRYLQMVAKGTL